MPEGSYSLDPRDGALRIRELKELVQSLHRQGFRVIMDVVYNHTYHRDSWLERTVPGYYYRHRTDGSWSEGSGCGNDLASERSMCGQYILDSVLYWAGEYHMDGFRFDLMGLLDTDLMQRIRAALDARYGRGEKLVFGEPWAAGPTACKRGPGWRAKEPAHPGPGDRRLLRRRAGCGQRQCTAHPKRRFCQRRPRQRGGRGPQSDGLVPRRAGLPCGGPHPDHRLCVLP